MIKESTYVVILCCSVHTFFNIILNFLCRMWQTLCIKFRWSLLSYLVMVMHCYRGTGAQFITFYVIITGPPFRRTWWYAVNSVCCAWYGNFSIWGIQGYLGSYVTNTDQVWLPLCLMGIWYGDFGTEGYCGSYVTMVIDIDQVGFPLCLMGPDCWMILDMI